MVPAAARNHIDVSESIRLSEAVLMCNDICGLYYHFHWPENLLQWAWWLQTYNWEWETLKTSKPTYLSLHMHPPKGNSSGRGFLKILIQMLKCNLSQLMLSGSGNRGINFFLRGWPLGITMFQWICWQHKIGVWFFFLFWQGGCKYRMINLGKMKSKYEQGELYKIPK